MARQKRRAPIYSKRRAEILEEYNALRLRLVSIETHYKKLCELEAELRQRFADLPSWIQDYMEAVRLGSLKTRDGHYSKTFKDDVCCEYLAAPDGAKVLVIRKYGIKPDAMARWLRRWKSGRAGIDVRHPRTPQPTQLPPAPVTSDSAPTIPVRPLNASDFEPLNFFGVAPNRNK